MRREIEVEVREAVLDRRELALGRDARAERARAPFGRRVAVRELGEAIEAAPNAARRPAREQHAAVRILDDEHRHAAARALRVRPRRRILRLRAARAAAQSRRAGRRVHAGRARVQSVAPRSMIACV